MSRFSRTAARLVTLVVCGVLLTAPLRALDARRPLETASLDVWREGLPQLTVQSIAQTSDGYLWLATFEGLVRFNGTDLVVIDRREHPEVKDWRIRSVVAGNDGELYIGTATAGLYRVKGEAFTHVGTAEGLPSESVNALARDASGTLYVATSRGVALSTDGRRFTSASPIVENVTALALDRYGALLFGTNENLYIAASARPLLPKTTHVFSLAVGSNGDVWIGTRDRGLLRVRDGRYEAPEEIGDVPSHWVTSLLADAEGSVWIGLGPGGLMRHSDARGFERIDREQGLPNSTVRALFEDAEKNLWIATYGGVVRLQDLTFYSYGMRNGLPDDYTRVVLQRPDGDLWVGTSGGGLARLRDGQVVQRIGTRDGLSDASVRAMALDREGVLWVGTGNGLNALRGDTIEDAARLGFAGRRVNAVLERRDGTLVVASDDAPLQVKRGGRFEPLHLQSGELARDARVVFERANGELWIGTESHGLLRYFGDRLLQRWRVAEGLPGDAVFALHEDGPQLWIGTHDGLALLRQGRIVSFVKSGLPIDAVFQILDDGRGAFWLTTNHGVQRVSRRELQAFANGTRSRVSYQLFTTRDGMANDQCNGATQPAGVRLLNGELAIPTASGLSLVDPSDLHQSVGVPRVNVTSVLVDGRAAKPGVLLPWSAERFEFRYEAVHMHQAAHVTFRYRMDGYDRDWVDAGTRRTAFYNSLPPGRHIFRVQARSASGLSSTSDATFRFERAAPPWMRWWAFLLYILGAAGLVWVVSLLRTSVLRRKNLQLELRVRERTAQLEESNQKLLRTSHDLEEANERLAELSATDALTCLANRRRLDQVLETEWRRAMRNGSELSLLVLDVDHFKQYNDRYGHQAGDECLRNVALALRDTLQSVSDCVARYGGEEFAAIIPATGPVQALQHGERLRAAIESLGVRHEGSSTARVVTVSIGVASARTAEVRNVAELLSRADAALYQAKSAGRNRVHSWSAGSAASAGPTAVPS